MANKPSPENDTNTKSTAASAPSVNVFAVHGADPEVQAYAMAKYSRSALSMKESLKEISEQKAEQFLNTFYFQYGHRSIADLAHVSFAIEKLSLLAAITLVDEQRWDGQERSTRYQNFRKSGYFVPEFGDDKPSLDLYDETIKAFFTEYEVFSEGMFRYLEERTPKPKDMEQAAYDRTLKARAFDLSRYLLPLATNTSLGQIVNARTLETQIARLLSHSHGEVRMLGELLKRAASTPSYNVNSERMKAVVEQVRDLDEDLAEKISPELLREVRVAPTLVKYATANVYETQTRADLHQAATELMKGAAIADAKNVELLDEDPLEIGLAATLLYANCNYPYKQLRAAVSALTEARRNEIIDIGFRHRGKHDELLRPFCAGQAFRFDILMDIGGFRDMHRHRRCTQIEQSFTSLHGFDEPEEMRAAGMHDRFVSDMKRAADAVAQVAKGTAPEAEQNSHYLLPLAYRKRCLFSMDFAEVVYITELRSGPAGHYSYRKIAWDMFRATVKKHPSMRQYFRVTDINQPIDLLKR